jgi:hypothetical protein
MKTQSRREYLEQTGLAYANVYPDDLSISKDHRGAWLVSAVFDGYLHAQTYIGYTKRESVSRYLDQYNKTTI